MFPDAAGRFDESLLDTGGAALVISQFTLYGDTARGNRPSFCEAAAPELAQPLYERVCERLAAEGVRSVERGRFGAHMEVELVNDGPVTIVLELLTARGSLPGPQAALLPCKRSVRVRSRGAGAGKVGSRTRLFCAPARS